MVDDFLQPYPPQEFIYHSQEDLHRLDGHDGEVTITGEWVLKTEHLPEDDQIMDCEI